jgi:serine/threonine-protein kinase
MITIGKYKVLGMLGRGGMGKVLRVEVPIIGRIAALKLLDPREPLIALLGMETLRKRFMAEALAMAGIRHPHICQVLDYGEDRGRPFYLMDYFCNNLGLVMGETYDPEAPSRPLPIDKAVAYARQILSGLARLHHAGMIHRDIKPFNILLTEEDEVKICDFGLSKVRGERFSVPSTLKVGTPCYAAPEQTVNPDAVDEAADLFSVGVIFYRMLSGRLPGIPLEPASRWNMDLDDGWDRLLSRMLARDPKARFSSASTVIQELDRLFDNWSDTMKTICRISADDARPAPSRTRDRPRSRPIKTGHRQNRSRLGVDRHWRPLNYTVNRWKNRGAHAIEDLSTGLLWQSDGTPYPVNWHDAAAAVARLNTSGFAGRTRWRLPTVDELLTLLAPVPKGTDYCLEPVFPRGQRRLWSCDRRAFTTAWYVSLDGGFVNWHDMACRLHAKAVCGP